MPVICINKSESPPWRFITLDTRPSYFALVIECWNEQRFFREMNEKRWAVTCAWRFSLVNCCKVDHPNQNKAWLFVFGLTLTHVWGHWSFVWACTTEFVELRTNLRKWGRGIAHLGGYWVMAFEVNDCSLLKYMYTTRTKLLKTSSKKSSRACQCGRKNLSLKTGH